MQYLPILSLCNNGVCRKGLEIETGFRIKLQARKWSLYNLMINMEDTYGSRNYEYRV